MEIRFNRTGEERKELVTAISEITGWAAVYKKAPTFAYVVHDYTIDKNGALVYDERTDAGSASELLAELAVRGFVSEDASIESGVAGDGSLDDISGEEHGGGVLETGVFAGDDNATTDDPIPEAPAVNIRDDGTLDMDAPDRLVIEVPLEGFTDMALSNLEKLVASKAALIMKSIGAEALPIEREDDRLRFPWFSPNASPEETHAYTQFVAALCEMAKKQRRVVAKEKPADSEKFAFRCFLLRLGFIGEAYASARKILLRNLPGDGSFKSGKRKDRDEIKAASQGANADDSGADSGSEPGADESERSAHGAEHARVGGMADSALAEALSDAELIHNANILFEEEALGSGGNE